MSSHGECMPSWGLVLKSMGVCRNRDTTLEFMNALPPVVDRVLSCFAIGLGYPEDKFKQASPLGTLASVEVHFLYPSPARQWC